MGKTNTIHYYFKVFNNIKDQIESETFAKLELQSLFGNIEPIKNFSDVLSKKPLKKFTTKKARIQDIITHEVPYGKVQGYYAKSESIKDIGKIIKRVAYTREIFVLVENETRVKQTMNKLFKEGFLGNNVQYFKSDYSILFRFITNQYFLEKSLYLSKLSRNEDDIDKNIDILFKHLIKNIYRIPSSSSLKIGKKLEDYFTIREEPSLYLNHYMHPYKGKYHPKMSRALLNYVHPKDYGVVCDNFAGSGTLLVEAGFLGLDSVGIEINPLSSLMCNVKCDSIDINYNDLKKSCNRFFYEYSKQLKKYKSKNTKEKKLFEEIKKDAKEKFEHLKKMKRWRNDQKVIEKILIAKKTIKREKREDIKEFLILSLSGAISDVARRTRNDFSKVLRKRINDLIFRIYLYQSLNSVLKIPKTSSKTYTADTRDMHQINDNSVDAIVNSPPYSTALDYIKNDYPQLVILELKDESDDLDIHMMGNPRKNFNRNELLSTIKNKEKDPLFMSVKAHKYVDLLLNNERKNAGLRVYKFFIDMLLTLQEMKRIMKKKGKCAIVIGNNHFKIKGKYLEIPNDEIILEIGQKIGFNKDLIIRRNLHKSSAGNIKKESVIIFQK